MYLSLILMLFLLVCTLPYIFGVVSTKDVRISDSWGPHLFDNYQYNFNFKWPSEILWEEDLLHFVSNLYHWPSKPESQDLPKYLQDNGLRDWNLHYMSCLLNIHKDFFSSYWASAELLESDVLRRQIGGFTARVPASFPVMPFHKSLLWFLIIFPLLHPMHKWTIETRSARVQLPLSRWLWWGRIALLHMNIYPVVSEGKAVFIYTERWKVTDSAGSQMAVNLPTHHKKLPQ